MRVLILGGTGFLGPHLAAACQAVGDEVFVTGRDVARVRWPEWAGPAKLLGADVKDGASLVGAVERSRPDRVFHLAGLAHIARSQAVAEEALQINAIGTQRVLEAVLRVAPSARVLCAGSCYEYGPVPPERQPIREDEPVEPRTVYGVSRVCGSLLARRFSLEEGVFVVRARSFNHMGRRQALEFAPPSFADQLVRGRRRGERVVSVKTGDLDVVRDFSGIEAAAAAYRALIEAGVPGEVYNVCSGVGTRLGDLLALIAQVVGVEVAALPDAQRLRAGESSRIVGDSSKLERATGLTLRGSLERAVQGLVDERESFVSASGG